MPNIKSAMKRLKTSERKRQANRTVKSELLSARRRLSAAIESGDAARGQTEVRRYASLVDKAAKKGVIKPNNASRRKSRAAQALSAVS